MKMLGRRVLRTAAAAAVAACLVAVPAAGAGNLSTSERPFQAARWTAGLQAWLGGLWEGLAAAWTERRGTAARSGGPDTRQRHCGAESGAGATCPVSVRSDQGGASDPNG
jgi:hypothetical protein